MCAGIHVWEQLCIAEDKISWKLHSSVTSGKARSCLVFNWRPLRLLLYGTLCIYATFFNPHPHAHSKVEFPKSQGFYLAWGRMTWSQLLSSDFDNWSVQGPSNNILIFREGELKTPADETWGIQSKCTMGPSAQLICIMYIPPRPTSWFRHGANDVLFSLMVASTSVTVV